MSEHLDLASHGYQIEAELGRNREGGRITWKGIETNTKKAVVIKQFCFARASSSWSGYKAYERELEVLQKLNNPHIPQYIDSIETKDGFCIVQEYVEAISCSNFRPLQKIEIEHIAAQILDVLIYLQQQTPPILHRDISPANILLDEALKVYLIDFGFACSLASEISASSVFCGTPGFIAPEQIIQPTIASDLYSLGVTLVCLLTQQDITEIRTVADADRPYQLNLSELLPDLEPSFFYWLRKMTEPKVSQRFADAKSARAALAEVDLSAIAWESNEIDITIETEAEYLKPKLVGGVAIVSTTSIATWGIYFVFSRVELNLATVAIAILATVAISVSQLGAAAIANSDQRSEQALPYNDGVISDSQARIQGTALAIIIPILLVCLSGLIWGKEEAIIITAAIAIAEIFLLSYFWLQLPTKRSKWQTGAWWSIAIAIGIILGSQVK